MFGGHMNIGVQGSGVVGLMREKEGKPASADSRFSLRDKMCFRGAEPHLVVPSFLRHACPVLCLIGLWVFWPSDLRAGDLAPISSLPDKACGEIRVLANVKGEYGQLEVLELDGRRILACDGIIQSAVPTSGVELTPRSLVRGRDYVGLLPYYRTRMRTALVVGLGAGIHTRALASRGITVHSVDIEPAIVPLAEKHFGFSGEVTVADGRAFLNRTNRRFDALVLDTFLGGDMPQQLYTKEAFQRMSDCLRAGGVLAVHLIARPQHPATAAVARTLTSVFAHRVAFRSGFGQELQNIYLLASHRPLELDASQRLELDRFGFVGDEFFDPETCEAPLLVDDHNCLRKLCRDLAAEHRQRSLEFLRRSP